MMYHMIKDNPIKENMPRHPFAWFGDTRPEASSRKLFRGISALVAGSLGLFLMVGTPVQAEALGELSVPLGGVRQPVHLELEELVSPRGEAEEFRSVVPASRGVEVVREIVELDDDAYGIVLRVSNKTDERLFLKGTARTPIPFGDYEVWNGYMDDTDIQFDPDDVSLSIWFPANAALGADRGLALGLHPLTVYSRVESGTLTGVDDREYLGVSVPFVLDPEDAENGLDAFEISFVVTSTPSRYGSRDVVQRYYDLFPEAYEPWEGIHPSVLSTQSSYLFKSPRAHRFHLDGKHLEDLARRFTGGRGSWEWWYAPFIRGGDWAITREWTEGWRNYTPERIERIRTNVREDMEAVLDYKVAPMYYVNLLDAERELAENYFPGAIEQQDPDLRRHRTPWRQETISGVYPGPNAYGDLYREGLRRIAEDFPASRGIAWDSAFGHRAIQEDVEGVVDTPGRSFNRGKIFALQAAAYAPLLDFARNLKAEGWRFANAVNLKLPSPYSLGARTDAHLYEDIPMIRPERLMRVEAMRARLGTRKPFVWHKLLTPAYVRWIDWAELSDEEVWEAFRQIDDDTVLLSYFWGGIFMPRALGSERAVRAVPELIDLSIQGWQPSPAVDAPAEILIARYGQGLGSRIAVINPDFKDVTAELFFPRQYWDDRHLLLAREDGRPLEYSVAADGAEVELRVPARQILLLRVVGMAEGDTGAPVQVRSRYRGQTGQEMNWGFTLSTPRGFSWETNWFWHENAAIGRIRGENHDSGAVGVNEPLMLLMDAAAWEVDLQADYNRVGDFLLTQSPRIRVNIDAGTLRDLHVVPEATGEGGLALVVPENPSASLERAAEWVREWFRFYMHYVVKADYEPNTLREPTGDQTALRFVVGGTDSLQDHEDALIRFAKEDNIIEIHARDDEAFQEGLLAFLNLMDQAYPYYGVLGYLEDPTFERAGMMGQTLEYSPQGKPVVKPTLLDYLRDTRLID